MGQVFSKVKDYVSVKWGRASKYAVPPGSSTKKSFSPQSPSPPQTSAQTPKPKPKPSPSELTIENVQNSTAVREPNSLGSKYGPGIPVEIFNCQSAQILILDWTSQLTIENCHDCFIFIAPCEGPLFVRDCTNCVIVSASHQLRTRDCKDVILYLFVATQPIIETSTNINVGCFRGWFDGLDKTFNDAGLSVWNNQWWNLYDFNDKTGKNFSLVDKTQEPVLPETTSPTYKSMLTFNTQAQRVVPITTPSHTQSCFLSFSSSETLELIERIGWDKVARTREIKFDKKKPTELFASLSEEDKRKLITLSTSFPSVFILALNCETEVTKSTAAKLALQTCYYVSKDNEHAQKDIESFWKVIAVDL